uniref:Peptidyl-prolyl cis-trans isomerase n=1 Tax=Falco tinnunculus TaxID=100819 RepID=A0A8C4XVI8_FALTI
MAVTLHTDVGDIKIELFCERTPKTCENFLALCASNYYNGCVFHRNIKGFMVQTGDPLGTGKGGNSIWGKKFEDEFSEYLKHSVRGVVSMANNGPNTNGSQFFITYGKQPHLDMKYTVFGKCSLILSKLQNSWIHGCRIYRKARIWFGTGYGDGCGADMVMLLFGWTFLLVR